MSELILGEMLDYKLKCAELERDKQFLQAKVAKYIKDLSDANNRLSSVKNVGSRLDAIKWKNKYEKLKDHLEKTITSNKRVRKKVGEMSLEYSFLKKRIYEVYGRKAYMDLINHIDNPRPDSLINTEERKQAFITKTSHKRGEE